MPIKIIDGLSAKEQLDKENIITITHERAVQQDIRPLRILILNLMPFKETAEVQLLRLLGDSPLQIDVDFCHVATYEGKHTQRTYLDNYYEVFDAICDRNYDGFIMTGAPIEQMPFEDVNYWKEITTYLDWAKEHVFSSIYYCWGAQAALYHWYGIDKLDLPKKLFGVYPYTLAVQHHPLLRGFDERYFIPQSRHTTIDDSQIEKIKDLQILSRSKENGSNIITTADCRQTFIMGHFEYDADSLEYEYLRDKGKNLPISVPVNYYPNNDDTQHPCVTWRSYAHLFYHNWLNFVYQETPYDLEQLSNRK